MFCPCYQHLNLKLKTCFKKGSTLVCSAHFKRSDMYKTITGLTCLNTGAVPSQFAWTKASQERPLNKLQNVKNMNEQQAQEDQRQSFVDSFWQDVQVPESAVQEANTSAEPVEEMVRMNRKS